VPIHQLDEFVPRWHPLILLQQGVPLRHILRHVKSCQKYLAGLRCRLNAKELITLVQPWQGVLIDVICGEQKFMAVARGVCNGVAGALTLRGSSRQQLVRLHAVYDDCQLTLIGLHRRQRCSQLVDDLTHFYDLLLRSFGVGCGGRHGGEGLGMVQQRWRRWVALDTKMMWL
jgi:hypothetical protein